MLVAASGGHLAQLHRLAPRIPGVDETAVWVTFDTPQSRSLLHGRRHVFVPYVGPRHLRGALLAMVGARRVMAEVRPSLVVSTGNAIAVSYLPIARAMGVHTVYIESAARAAGPSLSGRLVRWLPGVRLFTQYREWARPPWEYVGSVFDEFEPGEIRDPEPIKRVVVTLGTIDFGFRRLIERLIAVLPADCEILWQVGQTDISDLGISARALIPPSELHAAMLAADLVVAHAGIGSALAAIEAGRCPVLVPRGRAHGEHVDDHQVQIAMTLERLGLALHRRASNLQLDDLVDASRRRTVRRPDVPLLELAIASTDELGLHSAAA